MSKLNISKDEWLESVLEGKNVNYDAYQLRQEKRKTTVKAFVCALLLVATLSAITAYLISSKEFPKKQTVNFYKK